MKTHAKSEPPKDMHIMVFISILLIFIITTFLGVVITIVLFFSRTLTSLNRSGNKTLHTKETETSVADADADKLAKHEMRFDVVLFLEQAAKVNNKTANAPETTKTKITELILETIHANSEKPSSADSLCKNIEQKLSVKLGKSIGFCACYDCTLISRQHAQSWFYLMFLFEQTDIAEARDGLLFIAPGIRCSLNVMTYFDGGSDSKIISHVIKAAEVRFRAGQMPEINRKGLISTEANKTSSIIEPDEAIINVICDEVNATAGLALSAQTLCSDIEQKLNSVFGQSLGVCYAYDCTLQKVFDKRCFYLLFVSENKHTSGASLGLLFVIPDVTCSAQVTDYFKGGSANQKVNKVIQPALVKLNSDHVWDTVEKGKIETSARGLS